VQALFEAVRKACSPATWSRGVELVRADAVTAEEDHGRELVLRVATRGGLISHAVTFQLDDEEWSCDCPGVADACEHVAAAAIALRRARTEGRALPGIAGAPTRVGRLRYALARAGGGLGFERLVVTTDADGTERETPLVTTIVAVTSGRVAGPKLVATQDDLAVERALGSRLRGPMPREAMPRLLEALATCPDVRLDGAPVRCEARPVGLVAVLEDDGDGFLLRVQRDPAIRELLANGVALCDGVLRPFVENPLTGRERAELGPGRRFRAGDVASLVGEVLPELERRIPLDVRTARLPDATREPPRLLVEVTREGDALSVLPLLVYGDPPTARIDGDQLVSLGGRVPIRDTVAESGLRRTLQGELGLAPGHRERRTGEEALALAAALGRFRGAVRGCAHEEFRRAPALEPRLVLDPRRFEVSFTSSDGGREKRIGGEAVLRAWRTGESLVPLAGGGFAPLPADWLARFGERVADLLAARAATGALPRAALPDLGRLCDALGAAPEGALARDLAGVRALVEDFAGLPDPVLPLDLTATLRPYQRRGVAWLQFLRRAGMGGILADDMGLGKTLQALCALRPRDEAGGHASLVVTPTSVLRNWEDETRRFRPALRTSLYHGARRRIDPEADLVITTYAILRMDADALCAEVWDAAILDEAQNVKNAESLVARAAHRLRAEFSLAVTGTPIENHLGELWSEMQFANPGLLGPADDFDERVARPIANGDAAAAERLRERLRPLVLRRRKRDVAPELPPRTDIVLRCQLEPAERALYDAIQAATRADVVEKLRAGGSVLAALEALLRLRQAACHPALVPGQHAESSSKLALLLEELETAVEDGHKALVFSQWTSLLDLVEPHLARGGIAFGRLDGATRDRAGVVARFQDESGPPVLLVSLKAGGTGLNLTAADHVFLLDPWWNPAVEEQAADRAHRIGQTRSVNVYRLVAESTVEEGILALQARKRDLFDAALGESEAAARLTREDLLQLLA
jgi:superfamily II DNA or RNA helicase